MPRGAHRKRIILWIRGNDPLSDNAIVVLSRVQRMVPAHVEVLVRTVDPNRPQVPRVPCLLFKHGKAVVYRLEVVTEESVLLALKRLR